MLRALSICSGIGGLDIAMQSEFIGATTHAYCEIDPYACAVLLARMESGHLDAAPIFPDIFKLDAETLEAANIESVDIVYGGIPCQPFSQAGLRRADDDPRNLWPATRKLLGILGRPVFFLENVAGFTIRNGSEPAYAWTLLSDLAEDGYDFRWVHVRAEDVGAPHRRERFFLLAYTPDSGFIRSARNVVNTTGSRQLESTNNHRKAATKRRPEWIDQEKIGDTSEGRTKLADGIIFDVQGRRIGEHSGEERQTGTPVGHDRDTVRSQTGRISRGLDGELGHIDTHSIAKKRIALRTGVWAKHSGTGSQLGNSTVKGSQGWDGLAHSTSQRSPFPPSPEASEQWRHTLGQYPQLAPAIESSVRGVADGIRDGVDFHRRRRLQALGNAVVPQQAIYAWLLLTGDDWVQS
jgi:DNA (cytosine-5)-methyltransferase 1